MKKLTALVFILTFSSFLIAQPQFFMTYGECHQVIRVLQESIKNDSLVVDYFVKNYKINGHRVSLKKKVSPAQFIKFYQRNENKHIVCTHKIFDNDKVLLDTTNIAH